ncbi:PEP-utilizing enzyme [Mycoplasmatota bacterium WC30]
MIEIRGIGVSGKKTSGIAFRLPKKNSEYTAVGIVDVEEEKRRFSAIRQVAKEEIHCIYNEALKVDENTADIFISHELLLEDEELIKYIVNLLNQGYDLMSALVRTKEDMKIHFLNMQSEIFRTKVNDIDDVFERLINIELGINDEINYPKKPFILVCDDIIPSLIYKISKEYLKGIICRFGSNCSHGVILARTINLPVIIRLKNRLEKIENNSQVVMNGESGTIFILEN